MENDHDEANEMFSEYMTEKTRKILVETGIFYDNTRSISFAEIVFHELTTKIHKGQPNEGNPEYNKLVNKAIELKDNGKNITKLKPLVVNAIRNVVDAFEREGKNRNNEQVNYEIMATQALEYIDVLSS